jgi:MFS family permease
MLLANVLKAISVVGLLCGVEPLWALAFGGLGAAIYAPAKYGLITELLPPGQLVRANGYFESATVCAVILGTALGGFLVSSHMLNVTWSATAGLPMTSTALIAGMLALFGLYIASTLMTLGVRDSGARYPSHPIHPAYLVRCFARENRILWRDSMGGLSMGVTTLLWAVGATLQLIVLRWASESLGLTLGQAAYLQGITALGVVLGAVLASRTIALHQAMYLLPLGVLLGLLVPVMLWVDSVWWAAALLVTVGGIAGYFVVPMNALLQHRGHTLLTAGRSIAVQGFNENGGMLLMLALYAAATAAQVSLHYLIWGFGALVSLTMATICVRYWQRAIQPSAPL